MEHRQCKIEYILSENDSIGGQIAFEYLKEILFDDSILNITIIGQNIEDRIIKQFLDIGENVSIKINKINKIELTNCKFILNDELQRCLCVVGEYPNYVKIENGNYDWKLEYCDEFLTFKYLEGILGEKTINMIEKRLKSKNICFERKKQT